MGDRDWDVIVLRKSAKPSSLKTQQAISAAKRSGVPIDTHKKYGAATNKHVNTTVSAEKLDHETEELKHPTVGMDVSRLIQQTRQALCLTQKDLAIKINEKPQVINDYEAGRAIPNFTILGKLEKVLGIKLRGKDKGQAIHLPNKNQDHKS